MTGSSPGAPCAPAAAEVVEPLGASHTVARPHVVVGALFLVLGGTLLVVGSVLPWITSTATYLEGSATRTVEESFNGFSSQLASTGAGALFAALGVVSVVFGALQLAVGRVVVVAVASIAVGAVAVIATLIEIAALKDDRDTLDTAMVFLASEHTVSFGAGPWLMLVGAASAVAGGAATYAKRRS